MPARHKLMTVDLQPVPMHHGTPVPPPAAALSRAVTGFEPGLWEGPTLRELVDRVEHQFGSAPGLSGVFTLGFGSDEPLTPGDIQAVCNHLGLPAEDFGLDP